MHVLSSFPDHRRLLSLDPQYVLKLSSLPCFRTVEPCIVPPQLRFLYGYFSHLNFLVRNWSRLTRVLSDEPARPEAEPRQILSVPPIGDVLFFETLRLLGTVSATATPVMKMLFSVAHDRKGKPILISEKKGATSREVRFLAFLRRGFRRGSGHPGSFWRPEFE